MNMMSSVYLINFVILTTPIISSMFVSPLNNFIDFISHSIKTAFFLSLIPLSLHFYMGYESIITNWHWLTVQSINLSMSFKLDFYSILFTPVALYVTWSIMEFSSWYMHSDPNLDRFAKYLLMFLITMIILTSANNLFQLFVGWEGVGIMSFLLIGWWYGRSDANTAALQAILYNRIGDFGLVLTMAWLMTNLNTWDIQHILTMKNSINLLPLLGLTLAAAGKSAQFGLHPWLPSAMEGPTPVSALLHSSTMVVAGVFILIRFYPIMDNNTMKTILLCLGALTTLFTAICALTQNDIKKIIAFSTSSQLGLMVVTLGIGQPYLAFLHICTHAFFKAMLFLCSGCIIHNLHDEQDIRKMGGLAKVLPLTSSSLIIGSLALTGIPFLTGFYSKDLIIESMNMSHINAWALAITLVATSMTAMYSMRIVFFALMGNPRFLPIINLDESNPNMINPIKRLMLGSIFAGYIMSNYIQPTTVPQMTIPLGLKLAALAVTITGYALAFELNNLTLNLTIKPSTKHHKFSTLLGYFTLIFHRLTPMKTLMLSQKMAYKSLDLTMLELMFPKFISNFSMLVSPMISNQKGLIKLYFMSVLLILPLPLIILML